MKKERLTRAGGFFCCYCSFHVYPWSLNKVVFDLKECFSQHGIRKIAPKKITPQKIAHEKNNIFAKVAKKLWLIFMKIANLKIDLFFNWKFFTEWKKSENQTKTKIANWHLLAIYYLLVLYLYENVFDTMLLLSVELEYKAKVT